LKEEVCSICVYMGCVLLQAMFGFIVQTESGAQIRQLTTSVIRRYIGLRSG